MAKCSINLAGSILLTVLSVTGLFAQPDSCSCEGSSGLFEVKAFSQCILYTDSAFAGSQFLFNHDSTSCPTALETEIHFEGRITPYICQYPYSFSFLVKNITRQALEILLDSTGRTAWIKKQDGSFKSWQKHLVRKPRYKAGYMKAGKDGVAPWQRMDHLRFDESDLYRLYKQAKLGNDEYTYEPVHSVKDIRDLSFYPVAMKGRWLQLEARLNNEFVTRNVWIEWCKNGALSVWFAFNPL